MATDQLIHRRVLEIVRNEVTRAGPDENSTLGDHLHEFGREQDALLYMALYCPPLTEVDGSVLLHDSVETESDRSRFLECKKERGRTSAESSFNFVEVPYLFGPGGRGLSDEGSDVLAKAIAASWMAWIPAQYPGRSFVVEVRDAGETGSVVGLQFSERRQG